MSDLNLAKRDLINRVGVAATSEAHPADVSHAIALARRYASEIVAVHGPGVAPWPVDTKFMPKLEHEK